MHFNIHNLVCNKPQKQRGRSLGEKKSIYICCNDLIWCQRNTMRCLKHSQCSTVQSFSRVWLFLAPWTVAHHAPLSMGFFSAKNTGVGCPFLLHGIFPTQGSNPRLLHWQADSKGWRFAFFFSHSMVVFILLAVWHPSSFCVLNCHGAQ